MTTTLHPQDTRQRAALTAAHRDYEKILKSYALYKVRDRETSEDLVQDTFMKTWSYLVKGGKIDLMKSFLYHVLNNLIVDEYRKHKTTSLDVLLEAGYEPSAGDSERLIDALDGKGAILLIQCLPVKYRNVVRMRYIQNLSLAEMSLITGQTKNAMAVQIHRGLAKLKVLYGNRL